jgi:AcrR family transcriptional regulator
MLVKAESPSTIQDTRSRLLEVASHRIHRQGFFRTSLEEIAADAEIAKATIYHHFKNKEEFGQALIAYNISNYLGFLQREVFSEQFSGLERLRRLGNFVIKEFSIGTLDQGCPICNLLNELANVSEVFRRPLEGFFSVYIEQIKSALSDAAERGEIATHLAFPNNLDGLAMLFLSQLQGAVMLARVAIREQDRSHGVKQLKQTFNSFFALISPQSTTLSVGANYEKSAQVF